MIRLPIAERGFALALIGSAALHVAVLTMLLSFLSGSAPKHLLLIEESCIEAFLVPGTLAAGGETTAMPGRKRREADRGNPVAVAPLQGVPEPVTSAEKEGNKPLADRVATVAAVLPQKIPEHVVPVETAGRKILTDIRPPAEGLGMGLDRGALPGGGELSGSNGGVISGDRRGSGGSSGVGGAGNTGARRGNGESSGGNGAAVPASRREGTGKSSQGENGRWSPQDADAVPRYGENARPAYPRLARLRGYQGVVVLLVEVLVDGRVGQVGIRRSAGHEMLDRAALDAVRTWRFEPGRREGRAVVMSVEVPVRFVLNENAAWLKMDDRR